MVMFAVLLVTTLAVHKVWPDSEKVTPFPFAGGDTYETAAYRTLAEQGDAGAMFLLGKLYLGGRAMPVDLVEGHKWLNLATSRTSAENYRGYAIARDTAALPMTPREIAIAQKRAREWLAAFERRANTGATR
jgi:hypothetical protein